MAHSTKKRAAKKPAKPRSDFPLFPHATGRWAKKVRGKLHYFGKTSDDPTGTAALERWLDQKDDLLAGRVPRKTAQDGLRVADLLEEYMQAKERALQNGEIVHRTFNANYKFCKVIHECFGSNRRVEDLRPADFGRLKADLAKTLGPLALTVAIQSVRSVFKWGYDARLIAAPVVFGPEFKGPGVKVLRQDRHAKGPRMFEAHELRTILDNVTVPLKAMTLLGVNAGLGNHDVAVLPVSAIDFQGGWLNFPREKTGTMRRCPLWPETQAAVLTALEERPEPNAPADDQLVFITARGNRWVRIQDRKKKGDDQPGGVWVDSVSFEFRKWLKKLGIERRGLAFYGLRHTFRTIADELPDRPAIDFIMGHADQTMAAYYRERIKDDRLRAVAEHVRAWLFEKDSGE